MSGAPPGGYAGVVSDLLQGSTCVACSASLATAGVVYLVAVTVLLGVPLFLRIRRELAFVSMQGVRQKAVNAAADVLFRELVSVELEKLSQREPSEQPEGVMGLSEVHSLARRFTAASQRRIEEARFLMAEETRLRAEAEEKAGQLLEAVSEETRALAKAYELRQEQLLRWGEDTVGTQPWYRSTVPEDRGGRR